MQRQHGNPVDILALAVTHCFVFNSIYRTAGRNMILGIALIGCILLGKSLIYFKTSQSPVCSVGKTEVSVL